MNPSKSAVDYWLAINKAILSFSTEIPPLWKAEKEATTESVTIGKEEAWIFLAQEREKMMRLSHQEALKELLKVHKIDSRMKTISSVADNGLFSIQ